MKILRKEDWKQNVSRLQRPSAQAYVSKFTGQTVEGKTFAYVTKCCLKNCHEHFSSDFQRIQFNEFYDLGSKKTQHCFPCMMHELGRKAK